MNKQNLIKEINKLIGKAEVIVFNDSTGNYYQGVTISDKKLQTLKKINKVKIINWIEYDQQATTN